ncbi:nitroreductase family protein [Thermoproteota archaeon]
MEVLEAIKQRRSIRKYKKEKVPEDKILKILEAARLAPSAGNRQPWILIVVSDQKIKEKLAELADNQSFVKEAPIVIAVFGDPDESPGGYQQDPMIAYKQDPMIAVEHMCLEAVELGLGSCWAGPASPNYDYNNIKKLLGVPARMYMICLLPIGVPSFIPQPRQRKIIPQFVFKEKFGKPYYI